MIPVPIDMATSSARRFAKLRWQLALIALVSCASELIGGFFFGFRSVSAHIVLWVLAVLLVVPAARLADACFPSPDLRDWSIRTGVLAFAVVVLCGLALGALHLISRLSFAIVEGLLLIGVSIALPRRARGGGEGHSNRFVALAGVWIAVAAFVLGFYWQFRRG